jgi:2-oxoglutarate ferredoxin oxidoreductase subunit alpha
MDEETYPLHKAELTQGGVAILGRETGDLSDGAVHISFEDLAKEAGGRIAANTVAAGACLAMLGAPEDLLAGELRVIFEEKDKQVLDMNLAAAKLGRDAVKAAAFTEVFAGQGQTLSGRLIEGTEAIALGALSADCRFGAFYPMSPATGIMAHLTERTADFPLVVEQAEDEIAALNMVIGASFAGARALTATSGGGFSLMTEALGFAAMSETPVVVVNAQRPGPATGLATRTGQADLMFMIHASQDEFPRFVFAPADPAEAFALTAKAFSLAEKYQVPAIVMADQYLCDTLFWSDAAFDPAGAVTRHIVQDQDMKDPVSYRRYAVTDDGGVSPRALPCRGKALVTACSEEHDEDGHLTEEIEERVKMTDKRNAKTADMEKEMAGPEVLHPEAAALLVGWGTAKGAIVEAVELLRAEGHDVGCVSFSELWPFPKQSAEQALSGADRFVLVEQNATAQLGRLIRMETGLAAAAAVLKYDGRPLYPNDIVSGVRPHLEG